MTKLERDDIERLCNLKSADMADKELALHYFKKYVDKNALFCLVCASAVKIMFNRLRVWWNRQNKDNYRFIKDIN